MTSTGFASSSAERVAALHRYDILGTPDEAAFDRVADLAAHLLDAPMAGVHFIDDHCQWAKAQTGLDAKTLDLDVSFCVHELGVQEVLVVEDATADPRFKDNPLVTGDPGIRFYAGAVLTTPDGHALGRLCVIDTAPRPDGIDVRERETLRQLAGVVMDEMAYRAQPRHREEVLESITDGFVAVDRDWHITYINQRGTALLQRPQDELLGRYIWDEFPEAMELVFYEEYARVMDTGEAADFEAYFPPLQTWFHVKAYPFEGGLSIYFDDVTERKRAGEELRRQRDLLENIFDASPAAIVTLDGDGQLAAASPRAQEVLGLEPSTVTERAYNDPAWRIMTAQGEPMPEEELPFTRVMAAGEPVEDLELSIERPDGTRRLLSASGAPLRGAGGGLNGAVFVLEDITDRRRQEAIEQRFGRFLEAAPSEIYIFDAETLRFTQTSRGARTNLGYTEAELAAMTPLDLKPYDKAEFEALIQPLRTGAEELISFETTHHRKGGTAYPVQVRLQLSREESSPAFIAIAMDITDRKRRERELIEAKERAEEMSRLKSAFLANMSHEIRTPLTSIIGFTDVIAGQVEGKPQELLGMIRESGKRLEETLTSVLDLAKIEGESMQVQPERVDLAEEVRTATSLFRPKAEVKEIDLRLDVPVSPAEATLDVRALRRVLSNLISNAVKFTEAGQVIARLRLTGEEATVEVEDTGVGIAPDQVDRIFEEFAQESEGYTRSHEGVGLGLSITRRLVSLLGGQIEAESEKGVGSCFRVTLPRQYPSAPDSPDDPEDAGGSEASSPLGHRLGVKVPPWAGRDAPRPSEPRVKERPPVTRRAVIQSDKTRVLLVEDNELTRQVMPMLLQKLDAGYAMDVAERAEEALEMAEAWGYDLVLIDINLGAGPTGLDLMQRLRKTARYAETPMIACTAYAMPGDERMFLEAGFDAYLAKPFGAEQLLKTLQHALAR